MRLKVQRLRNSTENQRIAIALNATSDQNALLLSHEIHTANALHALLDRRDPIVPIAQNDRSDSNAARAARTTRPSKQKLIARHVRAKIHFQASRVRIANVLPAT